MVIYRVHNAEGKPIMGTIDKARAFGVAHLRADNGYIVKTTISVDGGAFYERVIWYGPNYLGPRTAAIGCEAHGAKLRMQVSRRRHVDGRNKVGRLIGW